MRLELQKQYRTVAHRDCRERLSDFNIKNNCQWFCLFPNAKNLKKGCLLTCPYYSLCLVSDMLRYQAMDMEDDGVAATNMRISVPMGPRFYSGNSTSSLEQNKVKLRDYFPESWLFSINYTNELTR